MRRPLPRTAALLLLAALAACSDSSTGARSPDAVRLAFAPRFQGQAAAIFADLAAFSLAVDNVRLTIRPIIGGDALGAPLKDTVIAFPANQNELRIAVDVVIPERAQQVAVEVVLREGATTFFEGFTTLLARQGETSSPPSPVEMTYVGPGASAAFLSLSHSLPTIAPSSALQFSVTAYDAGEHVVNGLPILWSSSDVSVATVSTGGLVTSTGKLGTTTITAKGLNGISEQTTVSVQPVARLGLLDGDKQSAIAGVVLPTAFVVQAFAANDHPVIGASITFSALTSGGTVGAATVTTGDAGTASTTIKLGAAIGAYSYRAAATGLPNVPAITIIATALAGTPAALAIVSGSTQVGEVATTLEPLIVQVKDALGNPVAGATVAWRLSKGSALLYPDPIPDISGVTDLTQVTGADGTSRIRVQLGTLAGPVEVTASVASVSPITFALSAAAGPAAQLIVVRQPSKTAQATIKLEQQPQVQLADLYGNPVRQSGFRVAAGLGFDCGRECTRQARSLREAARTAARMPVPTGITRTTSISDTITRGVVGDTVRATDANGVATFTDLALNMYTGSWLLVFYDVTDESSIGGISEAIALSAGPAASIIALEDTMYAIVPTVQPIVRVQDAVGNGIAGIKLFWDTKGGSVGRVDSTTTTTDANGYSSPGNWALPGTTGFFVLTVSTANGLKLENEPLPIAAFLNLGLGSARFVSPKDWRALNGERVMASLQ